MIKIQIYKEKVKYKVNSVKVKQVLKDFFEKQKINDISVSVAFVSKATMIEIAKKYYSDKKLHSVFSFEELKEIVVCLEAIKKEEELYSLLVHSAKHLIGIHHK